MQPQIDLKTVVNGNIEEVWNAWTTEVGIRSFFAPECKVELRIGGAYEMYFNLDAAPGEKGGEGVTILAFETNKMLSFTWNAPPHLPDIRRQFTHVVVRFKALGTENTLVQLVHDGWGESEEWRETLEYFNRAWGKVVLPRLQYRFREGPVDWNNPPVED